MSIAVTDLDIMIYCDYSGCAAQEGIMYWKDPEIAIREALREVTLWDGWLLMDGQILCPAHRTDLQERNADES